MSATVVFGGRGKCLGGGKSSAFLEQDKQFEIDRDRRSAS